LKQNTVCVKCSCNSEDVYLRIKEQYNVYLQKCM